MPVLMVGWASSRWPLMLMVTWRSGRRVVVIFFRCGCRPGGWECTGSAGVRCPRRVSPLRQDRQPRVGPHTAGVAPSAASTSRAEISRTATPRATRGPCRHRVRSGGGARRRRPAGVNQTENSHDIRWRWRTASGSFIATGVSGRISRVPGMPEEPL